MSAARKEAEAALRRCRAEHAPACLCGVEALLSAASALLAEQDGAGALHFVCTDFPGPGAECVFVECEDSTGRSINAGEWVRRPDGLAALVVSRPAPSPARDEVREAAEIAEAAQELNPNNYTHEEVCALNDAMIAVTLKLRAALASAPKGGA